MRNSSTRKPSRRVEHAVANGRQRIQRLMLAWRGTNLAVEILTLYSLSLFLGDQFPQGPYVK
jgi:hypothetical protein